MLISLPMTTVLFILTFSVFWGGVIPDDVDGSWRGIVQGRPNDGEVTAIFSFPNFTYWGPAFSDHDNGTFITDASSSPNSIDFKVTGGVYAGHYFYGIYMITPSQPLTKLLLAMGGPDGDRPKEFKTSDDVRVFDLLNVDKRY